MAATALAIAAGLYWTAADRPATTSDAAGGTVRVPAKAPAPASGPVPATPASDPAAPPLWREVDEARVRELPFFADEWSSEGRALVRVSGAAEAARNWRPGDRLTIRLPQLGETWHPVIEEIDDGPGHSRAGIATAVSADGQARRVVVTVGPTSVFAFIDTPDGTYELSADSDYGWLLPTASMMAGYDFSVPDYIVPDVELRPSPEPVDGVPGEQGVTGNPANP